MAEQAELGTHRGGTIGALIRSARRQADLSQRELAGSLGVSQPTLAAWETGSKDPGAASLGRLAAHCGLRLAFVSQGGLLVEPMSEYGPRDGQGRRFPAHLDVEPLIGWPKHWGAGRRYDRPVPEVTFRSRALRDQVREEMGWSPDHPTVEALRSWAGDRQPRSGASAARPGPFRPAPECSCLPHCDPAGACVADCECGCDC